MRVMIKAILPVESGNTAITSGKIGETMGKILGELKPDATYFVLQEGSRSIFAVFDLTASSKIPSIVEPFLLAFNASVECFPVMIPDDLMAAVPDLESAVQKFS